MIEKIGNDFVILQLFVKELLRLFALIANRAEKLYSLYILNYNSYFNLLMLKYNKPFLEKVENLLVVSGYELRYEKGNFKAGYCVLKSSKVIVINKYFTLEGRINCLAELIKSLSIDKSLLDEKQMALLEGIIE